MTVDYAYKVLFFVTLSILAVMIIISLIRTITGKVTVDRIIGLNMSSTITVIAILILTVLLKEDYIADIAIIYVMLSFISILILCKIYIDLFNLKRDTKHSTHEIHEERTKKGANKND